jgi:hypothetical protein
MQPFSTPIIGHVAGAVSGNAGTSVSYTASSNSSGNTTISIGVDSGSHIEVTTVTGSGSTTRIMILSLSNSPTAGATIAHRCEMPATAAITLEWRNATDDGTLITSFLSDSSGDDLVAQFYYNGSAWKLLKFISPANA